MHALVMGDGAVLGIEVGIPDSSPADYSHVGNDMVTVQFIKPNFPDLRGRCIHLKALIGQQAKCILS